MKGSKTSLEVNGLATNWTDEDEIRGTFLTLTDHVSGRRTVREINYLRPDEYKIKHSLVSAQITDFITIKDSEAKKALVANLEKQLKDTIESEKSMHGLNK